MHKAILVIGEEAEEQLEPYYEDLLVEPYQVDVTDYEVKDFLAFYLKPEDKQRLNEYSKAEIYEAAEFIYRRKGHDWNKDTWIFNLAVPQVVATCEYNPHGQWDWYDIGGRYSELLICKDKSKRYISNISALDISATVYNPDEFISALLIDSLWLDYGDYPEFDNFEYSTIAELTHCWDDFIAKVLTSNLNKEVTVIDLHY